MTGLIDPDLLRKAADRCEAERLNVLRGSALLDSEPDEVFDRFVRMASAALGTPIALVSLVDTERQWFKAKIGLDAQETPRTHSFCAHAIAGRDVFVVEDASRDRRFADNPLVTGPPGIRFYAGAPIEVSGHVRLGTVCVISPEPRTLSAREEGLLADIAAAASREIETNHLASIRVAREAAAMTVDVEMNHQMRNMFAKVVALIEMTGREHLPTEGMLNLMRQRIRAMDASNEMVRRTFWTGASMEEVARIGLSGCAPEGCVIAEGDPIRVSSVDASVLAPLVNELCHDAMSRAAPSLDKPIRLSWQTEGPVFRLRWSERTGSGATPHGSIFARRFAPSALGGTASVRRTATGVDYVLTAPAEGRFDDRVANAGR